MKILKLPNLYFWSKCYTDGVHPNTDSTNSFRNLSFPIKDSCLTVVDAYQCAINECSHGMCDIPSIQDMELWLFIYQLEGYSNDLDHTVRLQYAILLSLFGNPDWVSYQNACVDCRRIKAQMLELQNQTRAWTGKLAEPIYF